MVIDEACWEFRRADWAEFWNRTCWRWGQSFLRTT